MGKAILCACEDVTLSEVRRAFSEGHRDLESVKRYTGFGTGPCQGKSCMNAVVQELLRLGATPAEIAPFTPRPPVQPVNFGTLAALDPAVLPLDEGVPLPVEPPPERPGPSGPLPERADVVIVGGGILGLSLAHELTARGVQDVVVLERSYLNSGASGRNGGGVRAQWSTPTMVRLGLRSLQRFRSFAGETGVNGWFRRGGYLFLAPDGSQVKRLERNQAVAAGAGHAHPHPVARGGLRGGAGARPEPLRRRIVESRRRRGLPLALPLGLCRRGAGPAAPPCGPSPRSPASRSGTASSDRWRPPPDASAATRS